MGVSNILSLLSGVALFLFGMSLMGDGLKKVAGDKLELILFRLSNTTLKALLLGTGVTAVIQSSSATSVMVVGFINSGMIKLNQAIAIVLGAMVGTSITGWVLCLSSISGSGWVALISTSNITAVVAVFGILLRMFTKKQINHHIGDIMLGFAVLMFGMSAMSGAVSPLKSSPAFVSFMTTFSNPLLGIVIGALFTAILQSASAAVGIVQALSMTGAITFAVAYPVVLGIGIGACVPVLLTAIGARTDGKRTAVSYLLIGVVGAVLCAVLYYGLNPVIHMNWEGWVMNPVNIAIINSGYRIVTAIVLTPCVGLMQKMVSVFIKESAEEKEANAEFDRLDERFIQHPALGVEQSRLSVASMAERAQNNALTALGLIGSFNQQDYDKVLRDEDLIDTFEDKIGSYLVKLTGVDLTEKQNEDVSKYLHTLTDFERIGDHAMNIADIAKAMAEKKVVFTDAAQHELDVLMSAVIEIMDTAINSFIDGDLYRAYEVEPLEERIDQLTARMNLNHLDRLQAGKCSLNQGFTFNDLLTNIERIADHCSNIAIAMIELQKDEFDTHEYLIDLKESRDHDFDKLLAEYTKKYTLDDM